jgi:hypothetical protein
MNTPVDSAASAQAPAAARKAWADCPTPATRITLASDGSKCASWIKNLWDIADHHDCPAVLTTSPNNTQAQKNVARNMRAHLPDSIGPAIAVHVYDPTSVMNTLQSVKEFVPKTSKLLDCIIADTHYLDVHDIDQYITRHAKAAQQIKELDPENMFSLYEEYQK